MAAPVVNISTIGSAPGRDFTTVATWEAALPANLTLGNGRYEVGEMYADSDFTEVNTHIQGQTTDAINCVHLLPAAGENIIWKPTAGAAVNYFLACTTEDYAISGITFDGSLRNLNAGGGLFRQLSTAGSYRHLSRCKFIHSSQHGFLTSGSSHNLFFCLAWDNALDGYRCVHAYDNPVYQWCGAYGNGGIGFNNTAAGKDPAPVNCWSFANTGAAYSGARNLETVGGNWADDASLPVNNRWNEINVAAPASHFVDPTTGDFRLAVGSTMRQAGVSIGTSWMGYMASPIDLGREYLDARQSDRTDIGPYQVSFYTPACSAPTFDSLTDAGTSGELIVAWTSAEDWVLIVDDATGNVLGGGSGASGGVTIGGLTDATPYTLKLKASSVGKTDSGYSATKTATPTGPVAPTEPTITDVSSSGGTTTVEFTAGIGTVYVEIINKYTLEVIATYNDGGAGSPITFTTPDPGYYMAIPYLEGVGGCSSTPGDPYPFNVKGVLPANTGAYRVTSVDENPSYPMQKVLYVDKIDKPIVP